MTETAAQTPFIKKPINALQNIELPFRLFYKTLSMVLRVAGVNHELNVKHTAPVWFLNVLQS